MAKKKQNLAVIERRQQVLDYRRAGYSYAQIAKLVGCDVATAYYHVSKRLKELNQATRESAEQVLALELQRLDAQEQRLQEAIRSLKPDQVHLLPKFEDSLLKVSQQRCKLYGLVAPPSQQVNVIAPPEARLEVVLNSPAVQQLAAAAVREAEIIDQTPINVHTDG